jgi:hypothetical protein
MDARIRDKYSTFLEEDWKSLGYLDEPSSDQYAIGLTLPKLPIFHHKHHSRPLVGHVIWTQYSDTQYAELCLEMDSVLRLASAMLECPASLDLLYKIIYSPRRFPPRPMDYEGQPVFEIERIESNETRRKMARKALSRLADSLSFLVDDPKEDGKENCDNVVIHTLALHPYGINIADDSGTPRGIASVIHVNRNLLAKLSMLLKSGGDKTAQILTLQFKLAISICHNIAHAVGHAADLALLLDAIMESTIHDLAELEKTQRTKERVGSNEPFLENDSVAELGYCWENAVLGGSIQWANQVDHPLFFSQWPSFLTDGDFPRRARYKRTATQFVVPLHYLRNIHRQEFWDDMRAGDATALHIREIVGILVTNSDIENDTSSLLIRPGSIEMPSDGVDSFRVDAGMVKDPSASKANETLAERLQRISDNRKSIRAGKLHIANQINAEAVNARKRLQKVRKDEDSAAAF